MKDFSRWNVVALGAVLPSVFSVAAAVLLVAAGLASGVSWLQLAGVGYFALRVEKPNNTRHNKALHPTAYSFAPSFVPHFVAALPAAGELNRSVAARGVLVRLI